MILRDTANNPICLFFPFLFKNPAIGTRKVKWCRKTNSHSIPISHPLICLLCAFHSTVQRQDLFSPIKSLSCPWVWQEGKKRKRVFGKSNYNSIKTGRSNSRAVHGSKMDLFFYLLPTWRLIKQKIVSLEIIITSYKRFLYLPQYIQHLERLTGGYSLFTEIGKTEGT